MNIAYLAGIIDGEGHIAVFRRKPYGNYTNPRYSLRVEIGMCSIESLKRIQQNFGGTLYKKKQYLTAKGKLRKKSATLSWSSNQALEILKRVRPFLIAKSREADIAIDYQSKCPPKTYELSNEEMARREKSYRALREAKL